MQIVDLIYVIVSVIVNTGVLFVGIKNMCVCVSFLMIRNCWCRSQWIQVVVGDGGHNVMMYVRIVEVGVGCHVVFKRYWGLWGWIKWSSPFERTVFVWLIRKGNTLIQCTISFLFKPLFKGSALSGQQLHCVYATITQKTSLSLSLSFWCQF